MSLKGRTFKFNNRTISWGWFVRKGWGINFPSGLHVLWTFLLVYMSYNMVESLLIVLLMYQVGVSLAVGLNSFCLSKKLPCSTLSNHCETPLRSSPPPNTSHYQHHWNIVINVIDFKIKNLNKSFCFENWDKNISKLYWKTTLYHANIFCLMFSISQSV